MHALRLGMAASFDRKLGRRPLELDDPSDVIFAHSRFNSVSPVPFGCFQQVFFCIARYNSVRQLYPRGRRREPRGSSWCATFRSHPPRPLGPLTTRHVPTGSTPYDRPIDSHMSRPPGGRVSGQMPGTNAGGGHVRLRSRAWRGRACSGGRLGPASMRDRVCFSCICRADVSIARGCLREPSPYRFNAGPALAAE